MPNIVELETERLILKQWKDSDYRVFTGMSSDPEVMRYYPSLMSRSESNEMADKIRSLISDKGWGFWAVEEKDDNKFIGFVGLHEPVPELSFSPCVEIGWRIRKEKWGKGFATEAAKEALNFAFEVLKLDKVYSFSTVKNQKSRAVMERLGMINTHKNFEHPEIPTDSPLRDHVLYEVRREQWYKTV
ncbi:MAG: GNAT family N-acetyltransferase [Gammaproteobacteria bacterium]|nr:GNAT family N-acetyltransferase [Gammaproteobacteria bacterium]